MEEKEGEKSEGTKPVKDEEAKGEREKAWE